MSRSRIARALRAEDGMSMVETMVAAAILIGGLLATFLVLDGSRDLATVSERKEVAVHQAENQLERVAAIPYANVGMASAPGTPTPGDTDDPRSWMSGANFDWDRSSSTNTLEAIFIGGGADAITPRTSWSDGRFSGTLDTFVTTPSTGLKRVTVAVRLNGTQRPRTPIVLSTLVSEQAGS